MQCYHYVISSFFFQAEDGIRDTSVTGVQTCALPISAAWLMVSMEMAKAMPIMVIKRGCETRVARANQEIGRASCREREWDYVVAGYVDVISSCGVKSYYDDEKRV